jgi:hypothetical protein
MDIGNTEEDALDPDVEEDTPEVPPEAPVEESFFDEEKTSDESKWINSGNQPMPQQQQPSLQSSTSGENPGSTEMMTAPQIPPSSSQPSSTQ